MANPFDSIARMYADPDVIDWNSDAIEFALQDVYCVASAGVCIVSSMWQELVMRTRIYDEDYPQQRAHVLRSLRGCTQGRLSEASLPLMNPKRYPTEYRKIIFIVHDNGSRHVEYHGEDPGDYKHWSVLVLNLEEARTGALSDVGSLRPAVEYYDPLGDHSELVARQYFDKMCSLGLFTGNANNNARIDFRVKTSFVAQPAGSRLCGALCVVQVVAESFGGDFIRENWSGPRFVNREMIQKALGRAQGLPGRQPPNPGWAGSRSEALRNAVTFALSSDTSHVIGDGRSLVIYLRPRPLRLVDIYTTPEDDPEFGETLTLLKDHHRWDVRIHCTSSLNQHTAHRLLDYLVIGGSSVFAPTSAEVNEMLNPETLRRSGYVGITTPVATRIDVPPVLENVRRVRLRNVRYDAKLFGELPEFFDIHVEEIAWVHAHLGSTIDYVSESNKQLLLGRKALLPYRSVADPGTIRIDVNIHWSLWKLIHSEHYSQVSVMHAQAPNAQSWEANFRWRAALDYIAWLRDRRMLS